MLSTILLLLAAGTAVLSSVVQASCGHGLSTVDPYIRRSDEGIRVPTFGYDILSGPLYWHTLAPENDLCAKGTSQSPIIIESDTHTLAPKGSVKLHVPIAHDVVFENLGTTIEVIIGGSLEASGKTWSLAQFHFHTPSEHRVDLAHHEAEMHMVFEAPDASIAVLSFLIDVAAFESNLVLEKILAFLPAIQQPQTSVTIPQVDFADFQAEIAEFDYLRVRYPSRGRGFATQKADHRPHLFALGLSTYSGSLTTPPCSEGVEWHIATTPLRLRAETFLALKATTKTNNRYSQADPGTGSVLLTAAESALALDGVNGAAAVSPPSLAGLDACVTTCRLQFEGLTNSIPPPPPEPFHAE